MKKRLITFILAATMVVSFSACGTSGGTAGSSANSSNGSLDSKSDLYLTYVGAYDAIAEATSIEFQQEVIDTDNDPGGKVETISRRDIKKSNPDGKSLEFSVDSTSDVTGVSKDKKTIKESNFYKDGYLYINNDLGKIKEKTSPEDAEKLYEIGDYIFEENSIKDAVSSGLKTTFILDPKTAKTFLDSKAGISNVMKMANDNYEFLDSTFEVNYEDNSTIKGFQLTIPYKYTDEGKEGSGSISIALNIKQIDGVTIDFPKDLDSYTDETGKESEISSVMAQPLSSDSGSQSSSSENGSSSSSLQASTSEGAGAALKSSNQ